MKRRGVFLDLNGTLVEPLKQERLDELTLIPGVAQAVAKLTAAGLVCPVVTVQSRIAKGLFSMADFQSWCAAFAAGLQAQGAHVVGPYVCPHRLAEPCPCKKTECPAVRSGGSRPPACSGRLLCDRRFSGGYGRSPAPGSPRVSGSYGLGERSTCRRSSQAGRHHGGRLICRSGRLDPQFGTMNAERYLAFHGRSVYEARGAPPRTVGGPTRSW